MSNQKSPDLLLVALLLTATTAAAAPRARCRPPRAAAAAPLAATPLAFALATASAEGGQHGWRLAYVRGRRIAEIACAIAPVRYDLTVELHAQQRGGLESIVRAS